MDRLRGLVLNPTYRVRLAYILGKALYTRCLTDEPARLVSEQKEARYLTDQRAVEQVGRRE